VEIVSGILNSIGGLCIVWGAWVQAVQQYRDYTGQVTAFLRREPWRPTMIDQLSGPTFPKFRSVFWTFHLFTFASLYGWRWILIGGAFVLFGSSLGTIAAVLH